MSTAGEFSPDCTAARVLVQATNLLKILLASVPCVFLIWSSLGPAKSTSPVALQTTLSSFNSMQVSYADVVANVTERTMTQETTFYAHGDVPYSGQHAKKLETQMLEVPADAEFVIHVGDIRRAGPAHKCVRSEYESASDLFRLSHAPVFVLIGDNDWTDCPNTEEGLQLWQDEFVGFESKYWKHSFDIQRQHKRPYNFAFTHKGILFIGVNIAGGPVRDTEERVTRLADQAEWTIELIRSYQQSSDVGRVVIFGHANPTSCHRPFFKPIRAFIKDELKSGIPILYLNGDTHVWSYDPNFYNERSLLRIMVTGLAVDPLLKVSVTADGQFHMPEEVFVIDRRLSSE